MKHLRYRVFFQILIPTLCIYIVLTSAAFVAYRNTYKASMIEKKNTELLNISRVLSDWVSGRVRELMILAGSETFRAEDEARYREYLLQRKLSQSFDFEQLWFFTEDGTYWNTGEGYGEIARYENFNRYFTGELIFLYYIPEDFRYSSRNSIVIFAVPVRDRDEVIGLLGGSVQLSELTRQLRYYSYGVFDAIALVDLSQHAGEELGGRIIAHDNENFIGLQERTVYGNIFTSNVHRQGENVFVATLINNWKLVGIIESKALFFQLTAFMRFFILIMVLIVFVISAISIGISQLISYPVVKLTEMVNKMIQGDFDNEITVKTNDELQSLAGAFNLLNRRNIQLRTDDRFSFLGRISSRMAHEIRHPLQVIQIAAQSMNGENYRNMGEVISREIKNADKFVREILEIAKPNELSLEFYSMSRLLENVHRKFLLLGRDKGLSVEMHLDTDSDEFYFDVLKIEQVLTNILTNSLEMTEAGGRITLNIANDEEHRIVITITDTGPGFDKGTVDRIFDPYFTTKENGTGLGLSICYQILAAHGAHIELDANQPTGALTRLIFPPMPG